MSELTKTNTELAPLSPMDLIGQAVQAGATIEQMERLLSLHERIEANNARKAFFDAKAAFQRDKPKIIKTSKVSHDGGKTVKYMFAPLPEMQQQIDPLLAKHGLSYSFKQERTEAGTIRITCVVAHVGGHTEEHSLESEKDTSGSKNSIQSIASAVSYLSRYTFKNAFGLSEGDDDGVTSEMSRDELNQLALEKLISLRDTRSGIPDKVLARVNQIIENKEESSYKKAIKNLETYE